MGSIHHQNSDNRFVPPRLKIYLFFALGTDGVEKKEVYECPNYTNKFDYHAIVIVGYETGWPYWIIRNSYGSNWGIFGQITITNALGTQIIYSRTEDEDMDFESKYLPLVGPEWFVTAHGSFNMDLNLRNELTDESFNKTITWNVYDFTNVCDVSLLNHINMQFGDVLVRFMVLRDVVAATVEITLLRMYLKNSASIYGKISACPPANS